MKRLTTCVVLFVMIFCVANAREIVLKGTVGTAKVTMILDKNGSIFYGGFYYYDNVKKPVEDKDLILTVCSQNGTKLVLDECNPRIKECWGTGTFDGYFSKGVYQGTWTNEFASPELIGKKVLHLPFKLKQVK